jgi:pimeloyl-ACP methyl ester carboxylesterase
LIKFPAKTKPYKGMVLANPGGPGVSGVELIRNLASEKVPFLGLNYDFVSWDPRGSGYAVPPGNCALSDNLRIPLGPAVKRRALDKLYGPSLPGQYFDNVYEVANQVGRECSGSIGGPNDAGPHMSTATVARDMISILDAYAKTADGKGCEVDASLLNFWGISYGTFLGQTFASMFPNRVGRVLLDGVLDPDETAKESGMNMVTQSDEAFSSFFLYCHLAGPLACPFYTGTTPHDIFLRFEAIVNQLNVTKALEENWSNSTAIWIVLQGLKGLIMPSTYHAVDQFPLIGVLLTMVESLFPSITLEAVQYLETMLPSDANPAITLNNTWSTGCSCADNGGRYNGKKVSYWADAIPVMEKQSWLGGESQIVNQMFCSGWNITTVERYGGKPS